MRERRESAASASRGGLSSSMRRPLSFSAIAVGVRVWKRAAIEAWSGEAIAWTGTGTTGALELGEVASAWHGDALFLVQMPQRGALRTEDVEHVAVRTGFHRGPPAADGRRRINVDYRVAGVNIVIVGTFASAAGLLRAAQETRSKSSWNSITPWSSMEMTTKDVGGMIS